MVSPVGDSSSLSLKFDSLTRSICFGHGPMFHESNTNKKGFVNKIAGFAIKVITVYDDLKQFFVAMSLRLTH